MSAPSARPLVSIEEYVHTDYEPDGDGVDGGLGDRNVGAKDHSKGQPELLPDWHALRDQWGVFAIQETGVPVSTTRFRVPDLSVSAGPEPDEPVFDQRPLRAIEIRSPEDRLSRMQKEIEDCPGFGVLFVAKIDPGTRQGWIHRRDGMRPAADGVLRTASPDLAGPLAEIFPS